MEPELRILEETISHNDSHEGKKDRTGPQKGPNSSETLECCLVKAEGLQVDVVHR